ncbi:ZIP family metal transporter [Blastomonas aquatica]|uniref:ZIP family metal transporter n=1 Tax=Blastomonas aquatica TaxID=1510276 RepID=A0ABQ1JLU0_9SPHN|nr:ZIP family metal transporter [Blastomonas aquatica]GGB72299.1 ZIP family metal transporter [Blastomonas aquatica]
MLELAAIGIAASLAAGCMTGLGGALVAFGGQPTERRHNLLMGFAAGVMIAAAFFSLIIPGIERAQLTGSSRPMAAAMVISAVLLGALAMAQLGRLIEMAALGRLGSIGRSVQLGNGEQQRIALFVIAVTLHNIPEGTAVGVSFMSGDLQLGWATTLGIGIQNIPEGMAVAAALSTLGWSRMRCMFAALATGLIEPVGGFIGVAIVQISTAILPWALGFSAGAMLFVVMADIIPQASRRIEHGSATPALMVGLAIMMFLDVSLG